MQDGNLNERRQAPRVKRPLIIQYGYESIETGHMTWDTAAINDLSQIGVSFNVGRRFNPGEIIVLRITSPLNPFEKIEVKAIIEDSRASEFGIHMTRVKFIDIKDDQKERIGKYVSWVLDKGG